MKLVRMPFNRSFLLSNGGVPVPLLKSILDLLPSDTKLVGCGNDSCMLTDYIFFQSESFIDSKEGERLQDIIPYFHRNTDGTVVVEKIDFGNALAVCNHEWHVTHGFMDTYETCKICGVSK